MEKKSLYKYHYRPGYGSDKLLIEFVSGVECDTFFSDLFDALKAIRPNVIGMMDLWMNDEFVYEVDSDKGSFSVSKDIWDFAFITSDRNQDCISAIDQILVGDVRFARVEVDYGKYKGV